VDDIVSSLRSKKEAAMALVELRKNFKNISKELMEEPI